MELASHPGGVAIFLVASCNGNWDKLWQLWALLGLWSVIQFSDGLSRETRLASLETRLTSQETRLASQETRRVSHVGGNLLLSGTVY